MAAVHRAASGIVAAALLLALAAALVAPAAVVAAPAGSAAASASSALSALSAPSAPSANPHVPVLAYYYMWFNPQSWASRKTDLPVLGAYDSTNPEIIRQQVAWAKAAGIDALIASWKETPNLDDALAELVAECHRQGMKLVLIYEGLDVNRNPIPASTVSADLRWFADHYGSDPVFDVYGKPAVIWSGTWKFTTDQIAAVRAQVDAPNRMLLLGSEKDAASYAARVSLFDGDAYYWSSADPLGTPGYQQRLTDLAAAVHAGHGLWLAPAAVGFDARLNAGTSVVDRRGGATLRAAWGTALATNPDGVAVISWNEYTENSYIEPSRNYGATYLNVLAGLTGASGVSGLDGPQGAVTPPSASPSASPTAAPTASNGAAVAPLPASDSGGSPFDRLASAIVAGLVIVAIALLALTRRRRPAGMGPDDVEKGATESATENATESAAESGGAESGPEAGGSPPARRSRRLPGVLAVLGLVLALLGVLLGWAVPNVAGANFVDVRAVVVPVASAAGPSIVLGDASGSGLTTGSGATTGSRATTASALRLAVDVTNRYPLPVVLAAGGAQSSAPFEAAVYLRAEDGKLQRVWQGSASDPGLEEASDSPVGDTGARAAVVRPGTVRHDASTGIDLSFPLTSSNGTQRDAGTYYVRVWAYGIASPLVPFAIEPAPSS